MRITAHSKRTFLRLTLRLASGLTWLGLGLLAPTDLEAAEPLAVLQAAAGLDTLADDSDQDGLIDRREEVLGTDPFSEDTDGDGFQDAFEQLYRAFGFDPLTTTFDTDRDGLSDSFELGQGTSIDEVDSDGDRYADFDEILHREFGYDPLKPSVDSDFDGLVDGFEAELGTDPSSPDTDGDGAGDFAEIKDGTDPLESDLPHGELVGTTMSAEMMEAFERLQAQSASDLRDLPDSLVSELPGSEVLAESILAGEILPSAALIQRSVAIPRETMNQLRFGVGGQAVRQARYPSYESAVDRLQTLALLNPGIVSLFAHPVLRTVGGNELFVLKISDNVGVNEPDEEEILYMALHHARELVTVSVALKFVEALIDGFNARDPEIRELVSSKEIWIVPLLNPDGYEKVLGKVHHVSGQEWRKNIRVDSLQASDGTIEHQGTRGAGIDLNRNYDFQHMATKPPAQRQALNNRDQGANGLWGRRRPAEAAELDVNSQTYPGKPFSETETNFIKHLVELRTEGRTGRDGFVCALSWHSYGGLVLYPWGYTDNAAPDAAKLRSLADVVADATGYEVDHPYDYHTFGEATDWLYGKHGIYALTVETYGDPESNPGRFYPLTQNALDDVTARNVKGAIAFAQACEHESDDGGRVPDDRADHFRHYGGIPADAPGWTDIRTAGVTLYEPTPNPWTDYNLPLPGVDPGEPVGRLLELEMELYEPIPEVPDALFASWHFILDLDGNPSTGFPGAERPVGVFPGLGVDGWVDLIWNGFERGYLPVLFLGPSGISNLVPTLDRFPFEISPDRTRITLELPVGLLEHELSAMYGTDFEIDEDRIDWVAVTNYAATEADFDDPPSDFFPDRLYLPEGSCARQAGDGTALCLGGGRFQVEVDWTTPQGTRGHGQAIPLTGDTGTFWFFDPDNVELIVKVLDACGPFGHFWVFAGGLTNVGVSLTVTDTFTGEVRRYTNPQGSPFEPVLDTRAFATCGDRSTSSATATRAGAATSSTASVSTRPAIASAIGDPALLLNDSRFRVEVAWATREGTSGQGKAVPLTGDTGHFWFFDPDNVELVVKVLDACEPFGRFWVFAGGLTNVEVEIAVTDLDTGVVRTYRNPLGEPFRPILDTGAFATCGE